jgi:hypothetical protein
MVYVDDAFLPRQRRKVLEGGENSPHQSNLFGADRTWCYVVTHSAISQPHPVLKPYQQRVQTMNKLMVWFQHRAGLADGAVIFLWRTQQTLMLLAIAGSRWENVWFGVKIQTKTSTKIPLKSSEQGLSIGGTKMQWFYCEMILYLFLKVQNIAGSDSFWLCPD